MFVFTMGAFRCIEMSGCRHVGKVWRQKKRITYIIRSAAVRTRLELVTPCVTGMYSNLLN